RDSQETSHTLEAPHQSARNATVGSTFDPRRAGIQVAAMATAINATPTLVNTSGSRGEVWYNNGANQRPAMSAMIDPIAIPPTTPPSPSRTISRTTSAACAPSAMRTPISCVRCDTLYATTLYKPTVASTSARPPKIVNIVAPSRHECIDGATTSVIV